MKKNRLDNLKPFQKWQVPSATSAQKKAWRERKRQTQLIMDDVMKRMYMTKKELSDYVKANKKTLTFREDLTIKYVKKVANWKLLIDFLDRHVGKAPVWMELEEYEKPEPRELTKKEKEMIKARLEASGLSYKT